MFREADRLIKRKSSRIKGLGGHVGVSWVEAVASEKGLSSVCFGQFPSASPSQSLCWSSEVKAGSFEFVENLTVWSISVFVVLDDIHLLVYVQ